jgi:hypothetical protein
MAIVFVIVFIGLPSLIVINREMGRECGYFCITSSSLTGASVNPASRQILSLQTAHSHLDPQDAVHSPAL